MTAATAAARHARAVHGGAGAALAQVRPEPAGRGAGAATGWLLGQRIGQEVRPGHGSTRNQTRLAPAAPRASSRARPVTAAVWSRRAVLVPTCLPRSS